MASRVTARALRRNTWPVQVTVTSPARLSLSTVTGSIMRTRLGRQRWRLRRHAGDGGGRQEERERLPGGRQRLRGREGEMQPALPNRQHHPVLIAAEGFFHQYPF